jgi:hypothetical protein
MNDKISVQLKVGKTIGFGKFIDVSINKEYFRERFKKAIEETNVNLDNSICEDQLIDNLMKCFDEEKGE